MNAFRPGEGLEYVRLADGKDLDMTQPPPTRPTRPPRLRRRPRSPTLEQKLADAAAEVARVQAELSNARAADPNHPQVPVPYDGHAPVVMINGQQVPAGQAVDISAMLGGMFGGAGSAAIAQAANTPGAQVVNIPPVVTVNGQVVSATARRSTSRASSVPRRWPRSAARSSSSAWAALRPCSAARRR